MQRTGIFLRVFLLVLTVFFAPAYGADAPNAVQGMYSSSVSKVSPDTIRLGSDLKVEIYKLPALIDAAVKSNQKIILYLNEQPLKDSVPEIDTRKQTLRFELKRTTDTKDAWNKLLGKSLLDWSRDVTVTVGLDKGTTINPYNKKIKLAIISTAGFIFWLLFLVIVGWIFLRYAYCSAILRNYGPDSPYSLAFTQIAFWFFLVLFSYVFIWLTSGDWNCIPDSVLVLLGIATGTLLGARVIDDNKLTSFQTKADELQNQVTLLQAQAKPLEDQIAQLQAQANPPTDQIAKLQAQAKPLEDQIAQLQAQIKIVSDAKTRLLSLKSAGFLNDILNDVNGPSIHRLQMMVWTLVFGFIFCSKVYQDLAMPDFSPTQLALIGISSGTYLGFKLPEKH